MIIRGRKKRVIEAGWPKERHESEQDLLALHHAKQIKKDPDRMLKMQNYAREKLAERRRRGKNQGMIEHDDNTLAMVNEKKKPGMVKGGLDGGKN